MVELNRGLAATAPVGDRKPEFSALRYCMEATMHATYHSTDIPLLPHLQLNSYLDYKTWFILFSFSRLPDYGPFQSPLALRKQFRVVQFLYVIRL